MTGNPGSTLIDDEHASSARTGVMLASLQGDLAEIRDLFPFEIGIYL